jgi:delta 1-pyrroline-5-carboxylate dehydrogenase
VDVLNAAAAFARVEERLLLCAFSATYSAYLDCGGVGTIVVSVLLGRGPGVGGGVLHDGRSRGAVLSGGCEGEKEETPTMGKLSKEETRRNHGLELFRKYC